MPLFLLLSALTAQAPALPAAGAEAPGQVLYLVSARVHVRAEPRPTARSVARLRPFEVVIGRELVSGWLHLDGASGAELRAPGWIAVDPANVVTGTLEQLRYRLFRVEQTKWPNRVKLDVARGRIEKGYTASQVQLALGDPLRKELRRDRDDVTEAWTYSDRRVIFSHTGVAVIEPITAR